MMAKSEEEWMMEFLQERLGDFSNECANREDYRKVSHKINELEEKIESIIPEDKKDEYRKLYVDLSDSYTELSSIIEDHIFLCGVAEGARILIAEGARILNIVKGR